MRSGNTPLHSNKGGQEMTHSDIQAKIERLREDLKAGKSRDFVDRCGDIYLDIEISLERGEIAEDEASDLMTQMRYL